MGKIRNLTTFMTALVMCCLFLWLMPQATYAAPAEGATVQYSGTSGTVTWEIYTDGTMVIRPTNGDEGTMASLSGSSTGAPWYSRRASIKRVETQGTIHLGQNAKYMFYNMYNCTEMNLSGLDTSNVTDMGSMFYGCNGLTALDVSGWDTGNVTNMSYMFSDCSGLTSLDVSGLDTGNVTNMYQMFYGCSSLTSLDVSGWDTGNVTNMSAMFYGCSGLTTLDISGWDAGNVTYMNNMFYNCSGLTALDVSGWDTGNVTYMGSMFYGCSGLTSLDVSGFETGNVTDMSGMFFGCSGLTALDVSSLDTGNVTDMSYMFNGCSGLTALDVSGLDTGNVTNMYQMFYGCTSLTEIDLGENFSFKGKNITSTSNQAILPTPPTSTTTGKWIREDGTIEAKTPVQLRNNYDANAAAWSGKWVWEEKPTTFTVKFNPPTGGGYGGSMPDQKITAAEAGKLNKNGFFRFDYTFDHWDGSDGKTYTDEQTIPANTFNIGDTLTLTAVFTKNTHALNFVDGVAEFILHAGEKAVFSGLSGGSTYQVWEETPSGWQLTGQVNAAGQIIPNGTVDAQFTNRYVPGTATITLMAQKSLDGHLPDDGAFSFGLIDAENTVVETVSNNAAGMIEFAPIIFRQPGTFVYKIREVRGDDTGINYDTHEEVITVTVQDDGHGNLTAVSSSAGTLPQFENESKPGTLTITKQAQGGSASQTFTFEIELTNEYGQSLDSVNIVGGDAE